MRWIAVGALLLASGCIHRVERRLITTAPPSMLEGDTAYLKAHMRTGSVYVLSRWSTESGGTVMSGTGQLLDINRNTVTTGELRFPIDSVALFETNTLAIGDPQRALAIMTGITALVAGICALNPKTCFGSCPTIYAPDSTGRPVLQAEGFSASIAPSLAATDVDMLFATTASTRDFSIRVTNEAMETHVIQMANLLAAPRPAGGRVFATADGRYLQATALTAPTSCTGAEGDCLATVSRRDGAERFSLADSADLATRETLDLVFDSVPGGRLGLVIASRQTLLSTYLLYQALSYLGTNATAFLASLETGGPLLRQRAQGMADMLGAIDVMLPAPDGGWTPIGAAGETGPIAVDTRVVPLPVATTAGPVRIRLRMTRGMWRIDHLALAAVGNAVQPVRLMPVAVRRDGHVDFGATAGLRDTTGRTPLVTLPGDAYDIEYRLPEHPRQYELFLEARGYYLEWMRREWLVETDPQKAARMAFAPAGMLRELAPKFKAVEPQLEHLFWSSRYVRQ